MDEVLEALERLKNAPSFMGGTVEYQYCTDSKTPLMQDYEIVRQAILELKSIKESNPSEALENIGNIDLGDNPYKTFEHNKLKNVYSADFNTIKQALLKAQEPKQYLKWEDLDFEENKLKRLKVKMGSHIYTVEYQAYKNKMDNLIETADLWVECRCISRDLGKGVFDDLRLERVK